MRHHPLHLLVLLCALALAPAPGLADEGAVTRANLLASERFWPYQVALTRAWQPEGRSQPLRAGSDGVLIRVEASGVALVDFGRDGVHAVPVPETDLLERANRIRRGEIPKDAPNFVLAIGSRLLDSGAPALAPFEMRRVAGHRRFLAVFADPRAPDFERTAAALAPLREREGLLTIVFPQGAIPDAEVYDRLHALDWRVPFVHDHLAEAYARTLLPGGITIPYLLLQTDEGRVLFQGPLGPEAMPALAAVPDRR
jgi:hypothetical protein